MHTAKVIGNTAEVDGNAVLRYLFPWSIGDGGPSGRHQRLPASRPPLLSAGHFQAGRAPSVAEEAIVGAVGRPTRTVLMPCRRRSQASQTSGRRRAEPRQRLNANGLRQCRRQWPLRQRTPPGGGIFPAPSSPRLALASRPVGPVTNSLPRPAPLKNLIETQINLANFGGSSAGREQRLHFWRAAGRSARSDQLVTVP